MLCTSRMMVTPSGGRGEGERSQSGLALVLVA